jgi:diacylglycerol kinase family enzyme
MNGYVHNNSGSGRAAAVLESVRPLFRHANVKITEKRTEYAQHAFEIAYHLDVYQYDAIVTVSGDGLLSEVFR